MRCATPLLAKSGASALLLLATGAHADTTLFVRAGAPAGGDGASWATAYADLQLALDHARTLGEHDTPTILIAQGVYTPDRGTLDPSLSFEVPPGTTLAGGYSAVDLERDPALYPTVLSADLLGNDSDDPASMLDNAHRLIDFADAHGHVRRRENVHVPISEETVRGAEDAPASITLDALSVRGAIGNTGSRSPSSAARLPFGAVVRGCAFTGNRVHAVSGVGSMTIEDSIFAENSGGAAVLARHEGSPGAFLDIARCRFESSADGAVLAQDIQGARIGACTISGPAGGVAITFEEDGVDWPTFRLEDTTIQDCATGVRWTGGDLRLAGCTIAETGEVAIDQAPHPGAARAPGLSADHCTFAFNHGGVAALAAPAPYPGATFEHCTFLGCDADIDGVVIGEDLLIDSCTFTDNGPRALQMSGVVTDSTFLRNGQNRLAGATSHLLYGGAITGAGPVTVFGSLFQENVAYSGGALGRFDELHVADCTFIANVASGTGFNARGGAVCLETLTNSRPTVVVRDCRFEANVAYGAGGGLFAGQNVSLRVERCDFMENHTTDSSGGGVCAAGPCQLLACRFLGNTASNWRGGGAAGDEATIADCIAYGNSARIGGAFGFAYADIANTIVAHNSATDGAGGISLSENVARDSGSRWEGGIISNCLVLANHTQTGAAGGVHAMGSVYPVALANSILWGNTTAVESPVESQQFKLVASHPTVVHCSIEGWTGAFAGTATSAIEPMFVDPIGPDGIAGTLDDDYRLAPGSSLIDAGTNALPTDALDVDHDDDMYEPLPLDLAGNPRRLDDPTTPDTGEGTLPVVDIGPFEFVHHCMGDADGDNDTDLFDFNVLAFHFGASVEPGRLGDIDGDGLVSTTDFGILASDFGCTTLAPE